jgi:hypothetical protein
MNINKENKKSSNPISQRQSERDLRQNGLNQIIEKEREKEEIKLPLINNSQIK